MMAAVETRAAWQRTANRYFVQEDAKRSPKLACCPSSNPKFNAGSDVAQNASVCLAAGFMPVGWNMSNSNLSPNTKWGLQVQPSFGCQKDCTFEQLDALEAELEYLRVEEVNKSSKLSENLEEDRAHYHTNKSSGSSLDPQWIASATFVKLDPKAKMQGLKIFNSSSTECSPKHNNMEYYNEELTDLNSVDQLISDKYEKCYSASTSPLVGGKKTEPWWRTADKDELAFLVAQKSLEHIENCDLPPVQTRNVRRNTFSCSHSFCMDETLTSPLDQNVDISLSNRTTYARDSPICGSGSGSEKQPTSGRKGNSPYDSDKPFSSTSANYRTPNSHPTEARNTTESDPSKDQLLEALRHSQTRAREAEKAVKQAYSDKEHVIELIFQQASDIFAYKQWLQLLQLETICHQFKHKDQQGKHKTNMGKKGQLIYDITKNAVAFAIGLGLVGAGLLLDWTIGWLLPRF